MDGWSVGITLTLVWGGYRRDPITAFLWVPRGAGIQTELDAFYEARRHAIRRWHDVRGMENDANREFAVDWWHVFEAGPVEAQHVRRP